MTVVAAMPLKRYVNEFKKQEERRRLLAELRIVYGNALSDSNLRRTRTKFHAGPASSIYPFGRINPNSCQISNIYNTKRRSRPLVRCMPKMNNNMSAWACTAEDTNSISRRYEMLQRQALRHARFMGHQNQDKRTESTIHKKNKFYL